MKAALVYSGSEIDSADNQDTLVQLTEISAILKTLDIETYNISFYDSASQVELDLLRLKPDFVFNLVETLNGTDSLIYLAPALYELNKLPYTGCSALSLATLASKVQQKKILRLAELPTADFFVADTAESFPGGPWIVKSDTEHASVGLNAGSVVNTAAEASQKILQKTQESGGDWFAERFIDGREFNLSLIQGENAQPQVLPAAEILFINFPADKPKIIDYAAKWDVESEAYQSTQRSFEFKQNDQGLLLRLEKICRQCWHLFGLKGAVRIDFRIDLKGNPWILEINANPCLSSDAGLMVAAQKAQLRSEDVVKRLLPATILSRVLTQNV